MATSSEVYEFTLKFEKEFSLVSLILSCGNNRLEDARRWIVDSGFSHHMIRIRDVFLDISEAGTKVVSLHAERGVGHVRF